jgi:hypothetical protein
MVPFRPLETVPTAEAIAHDGFVLSVQGDIAVPILRYQKVGSTLSERLGKATSEAIVSASDQEFLAGAAAFGRCVRGIADLELTRLPIGGNRKTLFQRLLLPLSANDIEVTHMLGFVVVEENENDGAE